MTLAFALYIYYNLSPKFPCSEHRDKGFLIHFFLNCRSVLGRSTTNRPVTRLFSLLSFRSASQLHIKCRTIHHLPSCSKTSLCQSHRTGSLLTGHRQTPTQGCPRQRLHPQSGAAPGTQPSSLPRRVDVVRAAQETKEPASAQTASWCGRRPTAQLPST